jgi:hypothetical protein
MIPATKTGQIAQSCNHQIRSFGMVWMIYSYITKFNIAVQAQEVGKEEKKKRGKEKKRKRGKEEENRVREEEERKRGEEEKRGREEEVKRTLRSVRK